MSEPEGIIVSAVVFFVLWLVSMFIWSFWLDGISIPIAGVVTAGLAIGVIRGYISVRR